MYVYIDTYICIYIYKYTHTHTHMHSKAVPASSPKVSIRYANTACAPPTKKKVAISQNVLMKWS